MSARERLLVPQLRGGWKLWLAVIIVLAATCWAGAEAYRQRAAMADQQVRVEQLRIALRLPPPAKMSREERQREKQWAAMRAERDFRWYPIFKALEETASADIQLLEFAPDKVNNAFVLRGEARDTEALLTYLKALSTQAPFARVYLSRQKNVQQGQMVTIDFEVKGGLK